jgi:hypothetical protein
MPAEPGRRRYFAGLVLAATLAGCGGEDARTGSQPADAPRWTLAAEPVVRLGGGDGEASLHRVMAATRMPDGRIAVANAGSHQVRVFGPDGALIRDIGRAGDGPGEFQSPAWLGMRGDTLVVWDIVASRISRFLPDGTFHTSATPRGMGMFAQVVGAYPDGSLLFASDMAEEQVAALEPGVRRGRSLLLRVSARGEVMDTVATVPATEQFVSTRGSSVRIEGLPFGRRTVMALAGDVLYVGTGEDAGIRAARADGSLSDFLRVPAVRKPVSGADIDAYWANLASVGERRGAGSGDVRPAGEVPYPDALPPYAALNVDHVGRFWVGESRLPREWQQPARWWIFSSRGEPIATIDLPPRLHVLEIGEDWLLGRHRDEMERETVVLHRISPAT